MKKKGELQLSFGMIFSIILIVIFIAFAVYGITKFLNLQQQVQIKKFATDLQNDIDNAWRSAKTSQEESYILPKRISQVCFTDSETENLKFVSEEFIKPETITHINTETSEDCFSNADGKITIFIKKDFGENLVTLSK